MAATATTGDRQEASTMEGRLEGIFDAHQARLHRLATRLTRDAEEARDLVQETFLRAARHISRVPGTPQGEEAWLVRVLVNLCRDAGRRRRVRARFRSADAPPASEHGNEAAAVARATIRAGLARLPARRRAVVVLYYLEGRGVPECAALLGISRVTVRWHLSAARRALARILGGPEPAPGPPRGHAGDWTR